MARSPQRIPVIGGLAAWHVPLVAMGLGLGAVGLGLVEVTVLVGVLGCIAQRVLRGVVVEISPRGLTRGFVFGGQFLGRTTVLPWAAIASVHTDWRRPGDDTALATTVRDVQGRTLQFTTAMGLHEYWTCVTSVAAHVPEARRSGLTEALLSGEPPGRGAVLSAAATAGALALIIVALVAVHALWAQGRSGLLRAPEQQTGAGSLPASEVSGSSDGRDCRFASGC